MPIDPNILLQAKPVQLENPLNALAQISQMTANDSKNRLADLEFQKHDREIQQENALSNLYKKAIRADGTVDRNMLYTGAADAGIGSAIPKLQESFQKIDKGEADIGKTKADTEKTNFDTFKSKRDYVVQNLTGVLTQPTITDASIAQVAKSFMDNGINDPLHVMQMVASLPPESDQAGRRAALTSLLMGNMKAEDQMKYTRADANTVANNDQSDKNNRRTTGASIYATNTQAKTAANALAANMNTPEYKQDGDGNWQAFPKKVAPGAPIVSQPVLDQTGKPIAGNKQPPEAFSKGVKQLNDLDSLISGYEKTLKEIGPDGLTSPTLSPSKRAQLKSAYTSMIIGVKNLYELGALSGPDYKLMTDTLSDPTGFKGTMIGQDGMGDQLGMLKSQLKNARANLGAAYKQDVSKFTPPAAPPAAAVEYLKANPALRAQFDAKYGNGAAASILGK